MHAKYVILCNERGGILNDPVLLRLSKDEFWFSLADSDLLFWLQGVNVGMRMDVTIDEIDVCPVQIQGPKSLALMVDLVGDAIRDIPYYGLLDAEIAGWGWSFPNPASPARRATKSICAMPLCMPRCCGTRCWRRANHTSSWSSPPAISAASRPA